MWRFFPIGRKKKVDPPVSPADRLVDRLLDQNTTVLVNCYCKQREVAAECRRMRTTCMQTKTCVEAIASMRERRWHQTHESEVTGLMAHFMSKLRYAMSRVHSPAFCERAESAGQIAELVELAQSPEAAADRASVLADLDGIAADATRPLGVRKMAEGEARELRRMVEEIDERIANCVKYASKPINNVYDASPEHTEREVARLFGYGYVEEHWRGIEHLLPTTIKTADGGDVAMTPWSPEMCRRAIASRSEYYG
jgi:hypothetical protein